MVNCGESGCLGNLAIEIFGVRKFCVYFDIAREIERSIGVKYLEKLEKIEIN